jgi:hypothetical protein
MSGKQACERSERRRQRYLQASGEPSGPRYVRPGKSQRVKQLRCYRGTHVPRSPRKEPATGYGIMNTAPVIAAASTAAASSRSGGTYAKFGAFEPGRQ